MAERLALRSKKRKEYYSKNKDRIKEQARQWYYANYERARANRNAYAKAHRNDLPWVAARNRAQRKYLASVGRFSPQYGARQAVRYAVKCGLLVKTPCEVCGAKEVQGHHHKGYELKNWFEVRWLCRLHHVQVHSEKE